MENKSANDRPMPGRVRLQVAGAWMLVGIPLLWGVWEVFQKSLDLFR